MFKAFTYMGFASRHFSKAIGGVWAFLTLELEFTPQEEEFTAQISSWAVNSSLLPKMLVQGVLSPIP